MPPNLMPENPEWKIAVRLSPGKGGSSGDLDRNGSARMGDEVTVVDVHQARIESRKFLLFQFCVGANDHNIAGAGLECGGAIDRDYPGTCLCLNCIGGKTLAITEVINLDPLVLEDVGRIQ